MSGSSASPEEYADGLAALRVMLDAWSVEPLMVPFNVTERFALTTGQAFYSMGTGGDWDTTRPEEIEYIRVQDAEGLTRPVYPITQGLLNQRARVDARTPSRYVVSRDARWLFVEFDATPVDLPYVLVTSRKPFNTAVLDNFDLTFNEDADPSVIYPSGFTLTGIQTALEFPSGYEAAIIYNLAVHLRPEYAGLELPPEVVALAASTKANIK